MTRAVFDTTVLVSAFLRSGGVSDELLALAAAEAFTLLLSPEILEETGHTLLTGRRIRQRYAYADADVHAYLRELRQLAELVVDPPAVTDIVRDPNDDMIVACALQGRAVYVVSRDKDILSLSSYQGIAMVTPERFRNLLRQQA